jgi:two-component system chemotaxis sensor kinase CheA
MERKIRFVSNDVDAAAIENGPRRVMKEILMQLIRNSVAHGIETPAERLAKGKNEIGIIKLTIKLVNNIANIELRDDGRGLDYKKIAEKAVRNKIIRKEDATDKNMLIKAIFAPGFSTAENEGMHAGRGIGLNLVRDRIKEVHGAIKLRSEPNKGTLFLITIPIERRKPRNPQ